MKSLSQQRGHVFTIHYITCSIDECNGTDSWHHPTPLLTQNILINRIKAKENQQYAEQKADAHSTKVTCCVGRAKRWLRHTATVRPVPIADAAV